jgi:hypothetical protein
VLLTKPSGHILGLHERLGAMKTKRSGSVSADAIDASALAAADGPSSLELELQQQQVAILKSQAADLEDALAAATADASARAQAAAVAEQRAADLEREVGELRVLRDELEAAVARTPAQPVERAPESVVAELQQIWDDVGVAPLERTRQLQLMGGEVAGVYSRMLQREAESREELMHQVAEYEEDIRVLNRALYGDHVSDASHFAQSEGAPLAERLGKLKPKVAALRQTQAELMSLVNSLHQQLLNLVRDLGADPSVDARDELGCPFAPGVAEELDALYAGISQLFVQMSRPTRVVATNSLLRQYRESVHRLTIEKASRLSVATQRIDRIILLCADCELTPAHLPDLAEDDLYSAIERHGEGLILSTRNIDRLCAQARLIPLRCYRLCLPHSPCRLGHLASHSCWPCLGQVAMLEAQCASNAEVLAGQRALLQSLWTALNTPEDDRAAFLRSLHANSQKSIQLCAAKIDALNGTVVSACERAYTELATLWNRFRTPQVRATAFSFSTNKSAAERLLLHSCAPSLCRGTCAQAQQLQSGGGVWLSEWCGVQARRDALHEELPTEACLQRLQMIEAERASLMHKWDSLHAIETKIRKRQEMHQQFWSFEQKASDPNRFKGKFNSAQLLNEEKFRRQAMQCSHCCRTSLQSYTHTLATRAHRHSRVCALVRSTGEQRLPCEL